MWTEGWLRSGSGYCTPRWGPVDAPSRPRNLLRAPLTPPTPSAGRPCYAFRPSRQVSFRNRVLILFDWLKARVFGRDISLF